jgi:hypothetical protein
MRRVSRVACCGVFLLLAAAGGAGATGTPADLSVQVVLTTYPHQPGVGTVSHPLTQSFTLTCNPPAGTLPLGRRVCLDIALYPAEMLTSDPEAICPMGPGTIPFAEITITTDEATSRKYGGGCNSSPAGEVYYAAALNDARLLTAFELDLRCGEQPAGAPTGLAACTHGIATLGPDETIAIAEKAPAIAAMKPPGLFPTTNGAKACRVPVGGGTPGETMKAQCGVLAHIDSPTQTTVSFMEYWWKGPLLFRFGVEKSGDITPTFYVADFTGGHTWVVVVVSGRVASVSQTGTPPPQRWH